MYAIKTQDGRYYNGRANLPWSELLTSHVREAFIYSKKEAEYKAASFNNASYIHGWTFKVVKV